MFIRIPFPVIVQKEKFPSGPIFGILRGSLIRQNYFQGSVRKQDCVHPLCFTLRKHLGRVKCPFALIVILKKELFLQP